MYMHGCYRYILPYVTEGGGDISGRGSRPFEQALLRPFDLLYDAKKFTFYVAYMYVYSCVRTLSLKKI